MNTPEQTLTIFLNAIEHARSIGDDDKYREQIKKIAEHAEHDLQMYYLVETMNKSERLGDERRRTERNGSTGR